MTLTGANFAPGMTAAVGDRALTDVRVQSANTLTGTLPPGLCPGTYAVAVSDPRGVKISGGALIVQGVRTVTFMGTSAGQTAGHTGLNQRLTMPLPDVRITDTTCTTGDWSLTISVTVPTDASGNRQAFTPQVLRLESTSDAAPVVTPLAVSGGHATATIHLPHAEARGGILFRVNVDGQIPASAPAGQYALSVTLKFAE